MGLNYNALVANTSATDASSYTTASITPTAGRLLIAVFVNRRTVAGTPAVPTCSGGGVSWEQEETAVISVGGLDTRVTVFKGIAVSSGALTFTVGETSTDGVWSVLEVIDGQPALSDAVRQSESATGNSSSPAVTLAAFGNAANGAVAAILTRGTATTTSVTPDPGWTEVHEVSNGNIRLETQFITSNDTTAGGTILAVPEAWAIIAIELVDASVSVGTRRRRTLMGIG